MAERVRITDVSARDGLQNEPLRADGTPIPVEQKLKLIELVTASGVDEVEAASFVSPKWVPQMADAEEVFRRAVEIAPHGPTVMSALVPNEQGFSRAMACVPPGALKKVSLFTAASETFNKKNTNATIAESIERFRPVVLAAHEHDVELRVYISCAIACPFEGPIKPEKVRETYDLIMKLTPEGGFYPEIDLGDTIGVATPQQIRDLLSEFDEDEREELTLHLHDTFGRAASCVREGLELGVRSFDGAAGGLGGCPYASTPQKRAPGNIATETLVRTVHEAGFVTGIDEAALARAGAYAREIVGRGTTGDVAP